MSRTHQDEPGKVGRFSASTYSKNLGDITAASEVEPRD